MPIWAPRRSTNKKSLSNNVSSCLGVGKCPCWMHTSASASKGDRVPALSNVFLGKRTRCCPTIVKSSQQLETIWLQSVVCGNDQWGGQDKPTWRDRNSIASCCVKRAEENWCPELKWNKKELCIVREPFSPLTSKHALVLWGLSAKGWIDLILPWMEGTQSRLNFKASFPHPHCLCQGTKWFFFSDCR